MIRIGSVRQGGLKIPTGVQVDITRKGIFGNRIILKDHTDDAQRAKVHKEARGDIAKRLLVEPAYRKAMENLQRTAQTQDVTLNCWCKRPDREVHCHGDIIKEAIEHPKGFDHWAKRELVRSGIPVPKIPGSPTIRDNLVKSQDDAF